MKVKVRIGNSTMVLEVTQNFILKDICVAHFKSKSTVVDLELYCFRIPGYDYYLDLEQSINDLLEVAWVFQDKEPEDNIVATIILVRKAEKGDFLQRESLSIDPSQEAGLCVWAWKRGGSTGGILSGFKKRYFVLQSNTLFYSESPGSPVLGYIPMAGITSKIRADIVYKDKVSFELTTTSQNTKSYVLCADQSEFSQLHQALDDLQLRRVKASVVALMQELISRDVSTLQGIFRISGEKFQVEALKHEYDLAVDPDLTGIPSEVIAGVIKQYLRNLESPIIGFGLYNEYLRFGRMPAGPERTEAMQIALKHLPHSHHNFLHYLCSALNLISQHSGTNLMNTKNLSIVIGPNLLRPQRETTQTAMNDNQYVLAATQALIDEVKAVFGSPQNKKVPDTPTTTQHAAAQQRQRSASVTAHQAARANSHASPMGASKGRSMSISEIDPSLAFVQDLKGAMQTSKTLGGKLQEMTAKHQQVMQKWNDLIKAIKGNPMGTMNFSEIILNQSEIDTRWIDSGLSSLDQVYSNLSELVELLAPVSDANSSSDLPVPPLPPQPPQPPQPPMPPQLPPQMPPQVLIPPQPPTHRPVPTPPVSPAHHLSGPPPKPTPNPSSQYPPFNPMVHPGASGNYGNPNIPSQTAPPPPPAHRRGESQHSVASSSDIPPPPPLDSD